MPAASSKLGHKSTTSSDSRGISAPSGIDLDVSLRSTLPAVGMSSKLHDSRCVRDLYELGERLSG
eukprot:1385338-Amorphochlora_amoeboformis.AAC.1